MLWPHMIFQIGGCSASALASHGNSSSFFSPCDQPIPHAKQYMWCAGSIAVMSPDDRFASNGVSPSSMAIFHTFVSSLWVVSL